MWLELGVTLWKPLDEPPSLKFSTTEKKHMQASGSIVKYPILLLADYANDLATGLVDNNALLRAGVSKLWQDIQMVHFTSAPLRTIGLNALQDYDACYELVDRLIEWDAEVLLLFGQHDLMAEVLNEGLDVVCLPSLEDLRDSPAAKQRCYQALVTLNLLAQ